MYRNLWVYVTAAAIIILRDEGKSATEGHSNYLLKRRSVEPMVMRGGVIKSGLSGVEGTDAVD